MPISSTTRKAGPYIGNGTAATFPFAFKVFQRDDVAVTISDGNAQTTLILDSDYSVALNIDQDGTPGGSITLLAGPLPSGYTLVITSAIPETQGIELTNHGGFYPEVITDALDRLTALVQQLQESVDRSLKYPVNDPDLPSELLLANQRAGKFLYFGSDGSPSLLAAAPFGVSLFAGNLSGTVDGTNTVFTLTNNGSPLGKNPLQVTVWQNYPLVLGVGYILGPSAGQVTFTNAPQVGDTLFAQGAYQA